MAWHILRKTYESQEKALLVYKKETHRKLGKYKA